MLGIEDLLYDVASDSSKIGMFKIGRGEVTLELDMPGFNKEEIAIEIDENDIRISATNEKRTFKAIRFLCDTTASRNLLGRINLDKSTADAKLVNGVLTLTIKTLAKPSRIAIQ